MASTKNIVIISMLVMALCCGLTMARNTPPRREPPAETDSITTKHAINNVDRQVVWIQPPSGETDCDSSPLRPENIVQIPPVVTKVQTITVPSGKK